MSHKFVRCRKDNGNILGIAFESEPVGLPHIAVFWVEVSNETTFPEQYSTEDTISFVLSSALSSAELTATNLVKLESAGNWQHSQTEIEGNISDIQKRIAEIDDETCVLIKAWCASQSEGTEESFFNLGIADNSGTRYQDYLTERNNIVAAQHQKKIDEGLVS